MLTETPNPRKGEGGEEQLATPLCTKNTQGGLSIAKLGVWQDKDRSWNRTLSCDNQR